MLCPAEYVRGPVQAGPSEEKNKSLERNQNENPIQREKSPVFKVIITMSLIGKRGQATLSKITFPSVKK
jgi:hypothetical protein